MFDKLVASEPESADFKDRRRYFITSSVVVGVLFLAAVVASIFAADFGLGSGSFELTQMLAPVEMATVEPETPQPQRTQNQSQAANNHTIRTSNTQRIEENPTVVPTTVSTTRNTEMARPTGRFEIGKFDSNPVGGGSGGRDLSSGVGPSPGGLAQATPVEKPSEEQPAPRAEKKPKPIVSKGPLNGVAKYLPKPIYTAAAKAVRAQGSVLVQVTIDERGNVISANAVKGHPMLVGEAEKAARNAKFSPTTLSDVPVKVTGVITYNFIL